MGLPVPIPVPQDLPFWSQRSWRTGNIVCKCGCGYGSGFDGKCTRCRKGVTAWEAQQKAKGLK